jgi:hypothetical protein
MAFLTRNLTIHFRDERDDSAQTFSLRAVCARTSLI